MRVAILAAKPTKRMDMNAAKADFNHGKLSQTIARQIILLSPNKDMETSSLNACNTDKPAAFQKISFVSRAECELWPPLPWIVLIWTCPRLVANT